MWCLGLAANSLITLIMSIIYFQEIRVTICRHVTVSCEPPGPPVKECGKTIPISKEDWTSIISESAGCYLITTVRTSDWLQLQEG